MQQGPSTADRFPTTSWTRIRLSLASPEELAALLTAYWGPVYAYARRAGNDREKAVDLTQGFIARILEENKLLRGADASRGRFRSYLLTALKNHLIDVHRSENGRPGTRPQTAQTDPATLDAFEPCERDDPASAFRRQWATTALNLALERVEADCRRRGLDAHWAIYEARIFHPACSGSRPIAVDALAHEHGVGVPEVYSMLNTVKRKIRNTIESVVLDTLDDPDELDAELCELRDVLAMPLD